ncbi:cadherin domain-containing protein, partial [Hyphomonas sp.]|uniref:cadherin domain-containing protein n=1 Tax=Hyphomonas sp. TaxID=87 RepID=UPI0025C1D98E
MTDPAEVLKRAEDKQGLLQGNAQAPDRVETVAPVTQSGDFGYAPDSEPMAVQGEHSGQVLTSGVQTAESKEAAKPSASFVADSVLDTAPSSDGFEPETALPDRSPLGTQNATAAQTTVETGIQAVEASAAPQDASVTGDNKSFAATLPDMKTEGAPAKEPESAASTSDTEVATTSTLPSELPANTAPVLTSSPGASFAENANGVVYTAAATDVDAGTTLTYSLSGADASLFTIDAATGEVSFIASPNFEAPADAGGDNVYDLTVTASDGTAQTSQAVTISVTNVNEGPVLTSSPGASFAENANGVVYTAAATDVDAGTTLTYSLSGADASLFTIDAATGEVSFIASPNFEAPADAGGDNVYDLTVTASDGTAQTSQAVTISVTNVNEGP